jgi:hypothetical protein
MLYGNTVHDPVCGRCKQSMHMTVLKEGVYQDGLWFHSACHREGANQLYRAMRLANVLTAVEWGKEMIPSPHLQEHEPSGWYTD